jgi:hypothetical protein
MPAGYPISENTQSVLNAGSSGLGKPQIENLPFLPHHRFSL